jgi:hypothetical protein
MIAQEMGEILYIGPLVSSPCQETLNFICEYCHPIWVIGDSVDF